MLSLALAGFLAAWVLTGLLCRYAAHQGKTYPEAMPQRFHRGAVPRIGGAAVLVAVTLTWSWLAIAPTVGLGGPVHLDASVAVGLWLAAVLPAAAGVWEDLTQRVAARSRLMFTLATSVAAVVVFCLFPKAFAQAGAVGWPVVSWWLVGGLVTLFIGGLPHAFNLVDGYNGQAGMAALLCTAALAYVANRAGDPMLAALSASVAGATAGFLIWNYPRGLIFAGDGGAYLWGAFLASASVLLVVRHVEVSPLFPVLLLLYPVQETLFSGLRRALRGHSPVRADALHLHHLIYRRLVRGVFHDDEARRVLMRNNRTSPYLWGFTLLTVLPAVLFWDQTGLLLLCIVAFIVVYVWSYSSIVRFKLQRWVRR